MKLSSLICNVAVALAWDASQSTDLDVQYRLQWTDQNGQNPGSFDAGTNLSAEIDLPPAVAGK